MNSAKFLVLILFLLIESAFAQNYSDANKIKSSSNNFNISNYAGFAPSESKATFYIGANWKINSILGIGLKGGIYNYNISLNEGLNTAFAPLYYASVSNPGFYETRNFPFTNQNYTYVGALTGKYFFKNNLSFEFSAGMKYYLQKIYTANIDWSVPTPDAPIPELEIYPYSPVYFNSQKEIIKAYYSLGCNYKINNFNLGVFGDNVYSFGMIAGVSF